MGLKKYQKEYERFTRTSRKAYRILTNLYDNIKQDKKLTEKKDFSYVLSKLESYIANYDNDFEFMSDVNIASVRDKQTKKINNLIVLPIYPDEDIYVHSSAKISDFLDHPKE